MAACPFASSGARSTLTRQCHMWCRWHCQPAPAQGAPAQGGDPASTETSHRGRATEPRTSDRKPATAWEGRRRSSARRSSRSPPTSRSGVRERTTCTSTSGGARTCVLLPMYAFPGNPKAIWLTEALPAPLTNSYAPDEFICPITHEVMVDAVWAICCATPLVRAPPLAPSRAGLQRRPAP